MASQQSLIYKLQLALKQKGYIISISTYQFYSEQEDRYIKGYTLTRNGKTIYNSYSTIKIVKHLANILNIIKTLDSKQIHSKAIDTIINIRLEDLYNGKDN